MTGRPPSVAGGRPITVCVRLSEAEAQAVDAERGGLSRGLYLRKIVVEKIKRSKP